MNTINILLTGVTGFIGSELLLKIIKEHGDAQQYLDIDTISRSAITLDLSNLPKTVRINQIIADIRNVRRVGKRSYDVVIHAAAPSHNDRFSKNISPLDHSTAIVESTIVLIKILHTTKVKKFIFLSSGGVYNNNNPELLTETSPITLANTDLVYYANAKRYCELLITEAAITYNWNYKILRIFATSGPQMFLKQSSKYLLAELTLAILNRKPLILRNNSHSVRSFLDISDCVGMIYRLMTDCEESGVFNVGSDQHMTLGNIAEQFRLVVPETKIILEGEHHKPTYVMPSIEKAVNLINWRPVNTFNSLMAKLITANGSD